MPIHKGDELLGSVITFSDITERKNTEMEILCSARYQQKLAEASSCLLSHDISGNHITEALRCMREGADTARGVSLRAVLWGAALSLWIGVSLPYTNMIINLALFLQRPERDMMIGQNQPARGDKRTGSAADLNNRRRDTAIFLIEDLIWPKLQAARLQRIEIETLQ